jgi:hypothetical protein
MRRRLVWKRQSKRDEKSSLQVAEPKDGQRHDRQDTAAAQPSYRNYVSANADRNVRTGGWAMKRIGVSFNDGSLLTIAWRGKTESQQISQAAEARDQANKGEQPHRFAKVVEFDLPDAAMKEIIG